MDKRLQKEKNLKIILWFFVKLNLLLIPFYSILYFDLKYEPLQILFAFLVGGFFQILGFEVERYDFILYLGKEKFPVEISFDCIGWKSAYSLLALVLASTGKWRDKLNFLAKWVPIMFLVNFVRVIFAIIIGFWFGFDLSIFIHDYVLQPTMIVIVLLVWLIFISSVSRC
ncbi:MAG: exosortase/archaeosortase family protein [Candidatus Aenigmarchaeota archaeon]|nr:exosortase/archaeosortase family protein [Candidatus Aenigmarchaeota archaeon]